MGADLFDDPTLRAQMMASVLRGEQPGLGQDKPDPYGVARQMALADKDQVGMLLQSTGDRVLSPLGQGIQQRAQSERSVEATLPFRRLIAQAASDRAANGGRRATVAEQDQYDKENGVGKYARPDATVTTQDGVFRVNSTDPSQKTKIGDPLRRGGGKGGGMGPAAPATPEDQERMDFFARQYNLMGVDGLPPAARGKAGIALATRIQNRAHAIDPAASPGMAHVSLQANKADLAEATKQASTMDVNDEKAHADIASLRATMKPLVNTGSPWINKTFHELQENAGNADVAGYLGAMVVARAQINKVINSSTLTESARQEANEMLKDSATPAQTERVLGIIEQDMARSKDAMHKRVSNAQDRISGKKAPDGSAPAPTPAPALPKNADAIRARLRELDPDGSKSKTDAGKAAIRKQFQAEGLIPSDPVASK